MIWHEWDWLLSFHRDIRIGKSPLWMIRKHTIEHTHTQHMSMRKRKMPSRRKQHSLKFLVTLVSKCLKITDIPSNRTITNEWNKQLLRTATRTNRKTQAAVSLLMFGICAFSIAVFFNKMLAWWTSERALLCSLTTVSKFEMCARYVCYIAYCWRMFVNKIRVKPEPRNISHAIRSQKSNVWMANENVSIPCDRRDMQTSVLVLSDFMNAIRIIVSLWLWISTP